MLWLLLAFLAAFFTSMTTVLAKVGIKDVNSNFATLYRTGIVILCAIVLCLISNGFAQFTSLTIENWMYLVFSGLATGCSWLCYYRALKEGDVNKVAPIDKSSFILSSILFLIFFFDETTGNGNPLTISMLVLSILLMFSGTVMMIGKKEKTEIKSRMWIVYAILSAVFAALVAFLTKMGLKDINSHLGTLIRSVVVFIFALGIVLARKDGKDISKIDKKSWIFLTLSGLATGGAWLCENYAYNITGASPLAVSTIGKFSILLTIFISFVFFKEKFTWKSFVGLLLIASSITLVVVFSL